MVRLVAVLALVAGCSSSYSLDAGTGDAGVGVSPCTGARPRLDLEVTLPAASTARPARFAWVSVDRPGTSFPLSWGAPQALFRLTVDPIVVTVPVTTSCIDVGEDAWIKVELCRDEGCTDVGDPVSAVWLQIGRPIYAGEITELAFDLRDTPASIPRPPRGCEAVGSASIRYPAWRCAIDRCEVRGCVEGAPTWYCVDDGDSAHFCE